jgi:hypothetical protein
VRHECKACKFYEPLKVQSAKPAGECHLNPPTVLALAQEGQTGNKWEEVVYARPTVDEGARACRSFEHGP